MISRTVISRTTGRASFQENKKCYSVRVETRREALLESQLDQPLKTSTSNFEGWRWFMSNHHHPSNDRRKRFYWPQKSWKNPFWRQLRSLTFVVQFRFASASVLQPNVDWILVGFCRSSTDQGKPRPGPNWFAPSMYQLPKSKLAELVLKVWLGIFSAYEDSQWNPFYRQQQRMCCFANETIRK